MRVAVVAKSVPPEWGGEFTFSNSIIAAVRELAPSSEHEFVFYSDEPSEDPGVRVIPPPEPPPKAPPPGLRRMAWRVGEQFRSDPPPPPKPWFERSLEQERIDLVWFIDPHARDCDIPYIFTVLDIEYLRQPWFPEVSQGGVWERHSEFYGRHIPRATRVIVANEAGAEQVVRGFRIDRERILTLPHPTPEFALAATEDEGAGAAERHGIGSPYLFYPAQLWPHKNHLTLLEALAALNEGSGEGFELVLTGSDKLGQQAHLKSLAAELGVAERVHFLGLVETSDLIGLYREAFALTYMSLFGPENLPPLEAMALGCPAIVADVLGAEEQLGEAALRVPATDPTALAAAVRRLEDPGARASLIEAGRDRAAGWSTKDYVTGVVEFLDEFAHTRRMWS